MKRIAIDMDEVMADFISKHLSIYNLHYNERLSIDDLKN
ncbi:5'(3')-deoxyribonucleotidase [Bacillus pakistanensis]|uniref:5'(3')-deoxyribonucleotidase n=1 Tax=Rossellomorea pakistanensis TaxID=992288 RepID=A0ABS2N740_9BACI|nr:5'(3')-deoxyribonucleotidase [Bacillus pakistanensis]